METKDRGGTGGRDVANLPDTGPVLSALVAETNRVASLLEPLADTRQPVPRLRWTIGETAAHLTIVLGWAASMARGGRGVVANLDDMASINAASLASVPTRNGTELATLLHQQADSLVEAGTSLAPAQPITWHGGYTLSLANLLPIYLGEVVIHGQDIARGLGRSWSIDRKVATMILRGTSTIAPLYVSQDAARTLRATYEIRLRGGPILSFRFVQGTLIVSEGAAVAADCRISADPVAFLLVAYGRISQWGPILQGKLVAWGRNPWLAFKFKRLLRNP